MIKAVKILIHLVLIVLLSIITQIGGLIYLITLFTFRKSLSKRKLKRCLVFIGLYVISSFLIVPQVAPYFGRQKIVDSNHLKAHSWLYKFCNRNYVSAELNSTLNTIADQLKTTYPNLQLVYLDANFPFFYGFPLLAHLSHDDGKKIDLTFIYQSEDGTLNNLKPSRSGYGVYEQPLENEYNQTENCKRRGYWQYDFSKHLSLGRINPNIELSEKATSDLLNIILERNEVQKIFIEPHLKIRLRLENSKVRFHGCQAVRHDDHIHLQVR